MGNAVEVKATMIDHSRLVHELRCVMGGRFYRKLYVGYTREKAIKTFEKWLNESED